MDKRINNSQVYIENLAKNKSKIIRVKVLPNAKENAFISEMADGTLKIAIAAPPEKNRANQALLVFLAGALGLRLQHLKIISGDSARRKLIKMDTSE